MVGNRQIRWHIPPSLSAISAYLVCRVGPIAPTKACFSSIYGPDIEWHVHCLVFGDSDAGSLSTVYRMVEGISAHRVSRRSFSVQRREMLSPGFRGYLEQALRPAGGNAPAAPIYKVQPGDTLSGIVHKQIKASGGDVTQAEVYAKVRQLAEANGLSNPDRIYPGQSLDLSALGAADRPIYPAIRGGDPLPAQGGIAMSALRLDAATETASGVAARVRRILSADAPEAAVTGAAWKRLVGGPATISSAYGLRRDPFTRRPAFHTGVDIAAPAGARIYPMARGMVVFSGWRGGYGRTVIVRHADGLESLYAHTARNLVRVGDIVDTQTPLGAVGDSGRSSGPHLHFEVRRDGRAVNPMRYLDAADMTASIAQTP